MSVTHSYEVDCLPVAQHQVALRFRTTSAMDGEDHVLHASQLVQYSYVCTYAPAHCTVRAFVSLVRTCPLCMYVCTYSQCIASVYYTCKD